MNSKFNIYDLSENRIKQAIESLTKFHIDKMQTFSNGLDINLEILLQLVEKQKIEIQKKDKIISKLNMECQKKFDLAMDIEIERVKANKIIDEMLNFIEVNELDEEISKTYCPGTYEGCRHKEDIGNCKKCIKEYFEKRVNDIDICY